MRYVLVVALWLGLSYLNTGFLLADFQNWMSFTEDFKKRHYRYDLGVAAGMSLIPVTWIVTPFMTGFYAHGWMRPTLEVSK